MRKGFTLVEILVVIIVLPFVFIALDGLFKTLITDIPKSYPVVQENTSLLNMLEQMRQDIDKAKTLPESFAEHTTSDELLLIELKDGVICYKITNGQVIRSKLSQTQQTDPEETRSWSLPRAKIQWKVCKKNGKGHAVEIKTHIDYKYRGHWKKKMANSHLYFVGAL
jgi:prepilin-type N-terminal cleavage/methylation domain-containing protein